MLTPREMARIAGATALIALALSGVFLFFGGLAGGADGDPSPALLLPLDDAYIHLSYARSIAVGQPYRYNPDDPPTSGATSFLYPYLVAPGVLFSGAAPLHAGLWAKAIGVFAFAFAGVLVALLSRAMGARQGWGIALLAFMFTGLFVWHALSGMETMLIAAASLLALYGVVTRSVRWAAIGGVLCALLRPEGAILAVLTSLALWLHVINTPTPSRLIRFLPRRYQWRADLLWLAAPIAAIAVQPIVNLLLTGTPGSTGGSAKSLLGMIPFDIGVIAGRIFDNFIRVWRDLLFGNAPDHLIGAVCLLAIVGWVVLLRRDRLTAITIAAWMLLLAGAVATLDTAFWHFRRYQIPLIVALYPLAGVGLFWVIVQTYRRRLSRSLRHAVTAGVLISGSLGVLHHAGTYAVNISAVLRQPYRLARDLAAYPDRTARVAVHDVGLIRYLGGLHTIDIVGLTTPGAAAWWRQGPGAVGQYLTMTRPDLIAAYGADHGVGLVYLANTDLYAEVLSEYIVPLDANNVALAGATQGIYRPDYAAADHAERSILREVTSALAAATRITRLDVANLESEGQHAYRWWNDGSLLGFATEWQQFSLAGCGGTDCISMNGTRRLTGGEAFTVDAPPGEAVILVTRVHAASGGLLHIEVETSGAWQRVATRVIPALPGQWVDVPTLIPAKHVQGTVHIRIIPEMHGGVPYQPAAHAIYALREDAEMMTEPPEALAIFQDGVLRLDASIRLAVDGNRIALGLNWWADERVTGDLKRFVHVSDADEQIVAQADGYIAGALPAGNLLPGMTRDSLHIPLDGVPSGTYRVYIGLYDADTLERAPVSGGTADSARRIEIGQLTIEGES